jgi:hypothetical protein
MNEQIADAADDQAELAVLTTEIADLSDTTVAEVSSCFGAGDIEGAKKALMQLRYLDNCKKKVYSLVDVA